MINDQEIDERYERLLDKADLQIEQLQAELAQIEQLQAELAELRAEIERLRAALHWSAQHCLDDACVRRAMDALGKELMLTAARQAAEHPPAEPEPPAPARPA